MIYFLLGAPNNKTIANMMNKLNNDHKSDKIHNDSLLPFNLNDTSRIHPSPTFSSLSTQQEPQIITMQEGPSVFEMVVKHKIGPSVSATTELGTRVQNIKPTSTIPVMNTAMVYYPLNSSTIGSGIQSSMISNITEIRNHHNHHHTQMLKVSAPNTNTKLTDVVYGKRTQSVLVKQPTTTDQIFSPSKTYLQAAIIQPTIISTPISTLSLNSTLTTSTTAATTSATPTFGKPVIMQMPIENVKPKVGQFDQQTLTDQFKYSSTSKGSMGNYPIESKPSAKVNQIIPGQSNSNASLASSSMKKLQAKPYVRRPSFRPRPNVPIVRIDTCIVGDDSTCDVSLNEKCITELGLSSCQCRPGFARTIPRTNCIPVVSLAISFRVDKMSGNKVQFTRALLNSNSEEYQYLEYESIHALNSLFSQTKTMNTDLMAVKINRFYAVGGRTVVNATVSLRSNDTSINSQRIKRALQQELTQVIIDSNNNLGESSLSVDSSSNALTRIDDLNECSSIEHNDCSKNARCINDFGGFRCECELGYEDKFPDDKWQSGRICTTCSPQYCSNRGDCLIVKGERVCRCKANYIGSQCDIDVEVLGVAIGGSIAALVIIVITFICLYMWK